MTQAIQAVAAIGQETVPALQAARPVGPAGSFAQFLSSGVGEVNDKLIEANTMAAALVLDGDMPVHQVTYAQMEARVSLELMLQVRDRLVESYQDLMRMQL